MNHELDVFDGLFLKAGGKGHEKSSGVAVKKVPPREGL